MKLSRMTSRAHLLNESSVWLNLSIDALQPKQSKYYLNSRNNSQICMTVWLKPNECMIFSNQSFHLHWWGFNSKGRCNNLIVFNPLLLCRCVANGCSLVDDFFYRCLCAFISLLKSYLLWAWTHNPCITRSKLYHWANESTIWKIEIKNP